MVWAEFIMNGGTISDNEALGNYTYGGGVDVQFTDGASFTMNGGTVTDNVSRGVFGDSPEDVYTQNGAALVMGDDIQIQIRI